MYTAWLYFEDQFRDVYFPEHNTWKSEIVLTQLETGWDRDITFPVRMLDGHLFLTIPTSFNWEDTHTQQEREVPLDTVFKVGRQGDRPVRIIFKRLDREQLSFVKYRLPNRNITIGRGEQSDICDPQSIMSSMHGFISFPGGSEAQYADQSSNGTYINGRMLSGTQVQLRFGDVLTFPTGLKLVMLGSVIALNHVQTLRHVRLEKAPVKALPAMRDDDVTLPAMHTEYHRAPRMMIRMEEQTIEIEPPLAKNNQQDPPLWQQIGPSATMVLPMLMSVVVMNGGRSMTGLVMIGTSSALAVMWGLINRNYRKKQEVANEEKRIALYQKYIDEMEQDLRRLNEQEYRRLVDTFPNVGQCAALPAELSRHDLWSRMPTHRDFLEVRLGTGQVTLPSVIEFQPQKLSIIDDPLRDEPERLKRVYSTVTDAPYTVKLRGESVIGILGGTEAVLFAQGLLMQIAALHSYHDVRIAVLTEETTASQWEWVRWLPHLFTNEDRNMRMLASQKAAIHDVISHLDEVLAMRKNPDEDDSAPVDDEVEPSALPLPHYVIFCTNDRLLEDEPIMRKLLTRKLGTTLVMIAPSMEMLPKESHLIINLTEKPGFLHTSEGDTTKVDFEYPNRNLLRSFAQQIAPVRVHDAVESAAIPTLVSFLDIYGVRHVEDLDVWRMWSENRTYEGLRSVIGYTAGSRPFVLDISEKYHGPHGLIAGTTGSGKSVMLQTYILSLALNYSPQQIQFILIDYKGGGMADAFRDLPHVVGIIDNLQGEQVISRALASLNGEIHRRETLFREMKVNDITEYSKQYGDDPTAVKLPHLIIITDEFAELKSDQPEFMKELVSASRVGRSLGVHLILATQKPSASVSDEIWANSRFHLCLRVQTVADSRDMLKRPDAAYIKGTGRCFIQIGNDESFDQVQTSYSGLPYDPNVPRPEEMPHLLDDIGKTVSTPKRKKEEEKDKMTQMEAVLGRIRTIAHEHNMHHIRQMWMPEMPTKIYFNRLPMFTDNCMRDGQYLNKPAGISFLAGLADDTAHQRYLPYVVNLTEMRNLLIVGLAGTGKTTAVQSIVYSLANQYDPDHLNMYILSLTSRTLSTLSAFPHVGDIVFENDVIEVRRFIDMLTKEEERRSDLFAKAATDSFIEYNRSREQNGQKPEPAIVVFVDRYEQLKAMFDNDEATTARISALIREGSGRGIHFVVTAMAKNEVPYKLHAFFNGIALQLNDRADYTDAIGKRVPYEMPPIARNTGRGMAVIDDNIYEIQLGLGGLTPPTKERDGFTGYDNISPYIIELPMSATEDLTDSDRADQITAFAENQAKLWKGSLPKRIPRIPEDADWEKFILDENVIAFNKTPFDMPIGYDMNSGLPTAIDIEANYSLFITGPKRSGKTNMLKFLARTMQARGAEVHILADADWASFAKETGIPLHSTPQDIAAFAHQFQKEVVAAERGPVKREAIAEGTKAALRKVSESFTPYTIIIDRGERFYTDYNGMDMGEELKFMRDFFTQLFAKGDHYNFQLFVAAPFAARTYFNQEPLRTLIQQGRGVSLGGKLSECNALGIADALPHSRASQPLPLGQGYVITDGKIKRIVVPLSESADER